MVTLVPTQHTCKDSDNTNRYANTEHCCSLDHDESNYFKLQRPITVRARGLPNDSESLKGLQARTSKGNRNKCASEHTVKDLCTTHTC